MNKVTKGALAAAAAGALLLGGAGTYATWSDEATLDAGTVSTGVLDLKLEGGTWKRGTTTIPVIGDFRMVPGDTLTYETTAVVTAEGDNLTGTFTVLNNLTTSAAAELDIDLEQPVYAEIAGTVPANKLAVVDGKVVFSKADTYEIPLSVKVTLDANDQNAQNLDVDLGDVEVVLSQS